MTWLLCHAYVWLEVGDCKYEGKAISQEVIDIIKMRYHYSFEMIGHLKISATFCKWGFPVLV